MSERSHHGKLWAWSAAGLLAVVAGLGFAWSSGGPMPPPTASLPLGENGVVDAAPVSQTGEVPISRVESGVRSEAERPGIYGRLLDNQGQPLAGFQVKLESSVIGSPGSESFELAPAGFPHALVYSDMRSPNGVTTGANGGFAFPVWPAGDYVLTTSPFGYATQPVTLAKNERLQVTFQLAANEVATTGRVERSGELQESLILWSKKHGEWFGNAKAVDGTYRMVLPAGANTLGAFAPASVIRHNVPCGQHRLMVPQNQPRLDWTMALACSHLVVFARDERGMLPDGGKVTIRSLEEDPIALNALTRPVQAKGTRFPFLPPGDYEVQVAGEQLATVPVQKLTVGAANRREELHFVVPRATTVRLLVHAAGKTMQALPGESMPVLRIGGVDYPYGKIEHRSGTYRGRVFGYQNHPPGNASIVSEDRVVAGELRFLAFDPVPEQFVHALLHQPNELTLEVTRRAFVDLRACESSGREQSSASIEVFAGEQKVCSLPVRFCQRFRSYLPPGDYRIVVDRGGERTEQALVVARKDIRLRLRP